MTAWAVGSQSGISYVTSSSGFRDKNTSKPVSDPVKLIPDGRGGRFSPFINPVTLAQQFVIAGDDGSLSLLLQDTPKTGLWKRMPYYIPVLEGTVDFDSYFVHCTVQDEDGVVQPNAKLTLHCSSYTTVHIAGRRIELGPGGIPVTTDARGCLDLVISAPDVSSFTYGVRDAAGTDLFKGQLQPIVPDRNLDDRLATIKSADDLKTAKLSNGELLLQGARKLRDDELRDVAEAIQRVRTARAEKLKKETKELGQKPTLRPDTSPFLPGIPVKLERPNLVCGHNIDTIIKAAAEGGITDMLWSMWHGIESGLEQFKTWAVHVAGDVYHFILYIGKTTYRWVIDTVAAAGKVLDALFRKVLQVTAKIVLWVGFVFSWTDVQATHRSLVHLVNSGADAVVNSIESAESKVVQFFQDVKASVRKLDQLPDEVSNKNPDSPVDTDEDRKKKNRQIRQSAPVNYTFYQSIFGGVSEGCVLHGDPGVATDEQIAIVNDVIVPVAKSIRETIATVGEDIAALLADDRSNLTVGKVLEVGIDAIVGIIDAIEKLAVGILKVLESLIKNMEEFINFKVDVPVFSSLYKRFISGGEDLTILDFLAVLVAMPLTIGHKIATGKAPGDLTKLNYINLITGETSREEYTHDVNSTFAVTELLLTMFMGLINVIADLAPWQESGGMALASASAPYDPQSQIDTDDHEDMEKHIPAFMSTRAVSRLRSAHPLVRAPTVKGDLLKLKGFVFNWRMVTLYKIAIRIVTIPVKIDGSQPGFPFRWLSWAGSATGDAVYVAIHLAADAMVVAVDEEEDTQHKKEQREMARELIVPLAVLSSGQALYGFGMDVVTIIEDWNYQPKLDSILDGVATVWLNTSTILSNIAIVDPEEETSADLDTASYILLGCGIVAKVGKFVHDNHGDILPAARYVLSPSLDVVNLVVQLGV
ncbi:hypothetical protein F4802DRAFT_585629 [Xylaria palmicola]|nr:hypothetical protein F4802DRAFT_585629 [Xylaria palmicola]